MFIMIASNSVFRLLNSIVAWREVTILFYIFFIVFYFTRAGGASGVMREIIPTSRGEIKVIDFQGRGEARKGNIKREA